MANPTVFVQDLGRLEYAAAWSLQESLLQQNVLIKTRQRNGDGAGEKTQNHLLFVEHPPVYTLGKSGKEEHVLLSAREMSEKGIGFYKTNRGGDITWHGPEQVVGYPIIDLEQFQTDIGLYLRNLEEVIIRTIADYGLKGDRSAGETGVWLDVGIPGKARKIAALGVRCSRWITMHGFALNVNPDLSYFNYIIPCGIRDKTVTSMQAELGFPVDTAAVKEKLKAAFALVFSADLGEAPAANGIAHTMRSEIPGPA